jgi:hypothetical protein
MAPVNLVCIDTAVLEHRVHGETFKTCCAVDFRFIRVSINVMLGVELTEADNSEPNERRGRGQAGGSILARRNVAGMTAAVRVGRVYALRKAGGGIHSDPVVSEVQEAQMRPTQALQAGP